MNPTLNLPPGPANLPKKVKAELSLLLTCTKIPDHSDGIGEEGNYVSTRDIARLHVAEFHHDILLEHVLGVPALEKLVGMIIAFTYGGINVDIEGVELVIRTQMAEESKQSVLDVADSHAVVCTHPQMQDLDLIQCRKGRGRHVRESR